MEAGKLITGPRGRAAGADAREPRPAGQRLDHHPLYAGIQLILPGEVAPAHRHTQSALRFIIEGSGAYTAVNGEQAIMQPGDLILTPSWTWHDHGNETPQPMVWLDGLDIPLVRFLDAGFVEPANADRQSLRARWAIPSPASGPTWRRWTGSRRPRPAPTSIIPTAAPARRWPPSPGTATPTPATATSSASSIRRPAGR